MTAGQELERQWRRAFMAMQYANDAPDLACQRMLAGGLLATYFELIERALQVKHGTID